MVRSLASGSGISGAGSFFVNCGRSIGFSRSYAGVQSGLVVLMRAPHRIWPSAQMDVVNLSVSGEMLHRIWPKA